MKIIKEITDKCFKLNALASKISPDTTIGELNYLRREIESLRVMTRGLRIDQTPVDMVEMTLNSKLHTAMYHAKDESNIPFVTMQKFDKPLVYEPFVPKFTMAE